MHVQNGRKAVDGNTFETNRGNAVTEPLTLNYAFPRSTGSKSTGDTADVKLDGTRVNRRQLRRSNGTHIAFFARLKSSSPKLQPGQNITFNDVLTNIGSAYNSLNGKFIAPVAGVYVFHASVLSNSVHCHTRLVKNNQVLAMFETHELYDHASHMAIIELEAGDDVTVQNADWNDRSYYGNYFSTFSGFLLYAYSEPEIIIG